jgi:hypothetical protein
MGYEKILETGTDVTHPVSVPLGTPVTNEGLKTSQAVGSVFVKKTKAHIMAIA